MASSISGSRQIFVSSQQISTNPTIFPSYTENYWEPISFPRSFQFLAFSTLRYSDFEEICRVILTCGELPTHGFFSHVKDFFRGYYAFQKLYQGTNNTVAKLGFSIWHPLSRKLLFFFSPMSIRICCKPTLRVTNTIFQIRTSRVWISGIVNIVD